MRVPNCVIKDLYDIVCDRLRVDRVPLKVRRPDSYGDDLSGCYYVSGKQSRPRTTRKIQWERVDSEWVVLSVGPDADFASVAALVLHEVCHVAGGPDERSHGKAWKERFAREARRMYPGLRIDPRQPYMQLNTQIRERITAHLRSR